MNSEKLNWIYPIGFTAFIFAAIIGFLSMPHTLKRLYPRIEAMEKNLQELTNRYNSEILELRLHTHRYYDGMAVGKNKKGLVDGK